MIPIVVQTAWSQKRGSSVAEYEDAFCHSGGTDGRHVGRDFRIAVGDGATESLLSGRWAACLCRSFVESRRENFREQIAHARSEWKDLLSEYVLQREKSGRPIAWYEEPGLARGAEATLLAGEFASRRSGRGSCRFLAVGDTNLFQVRRNTLIRRFPIAAASEFDSSPRLVSSRPAGLPQRLSALLRWRRDDEFFLATDALAAWFLMEYEEGRGPWNVLREVLQGTGESFPQWVLDRRTEGTLRNDDTTVVRLLMA